MRAPFLGILRCRVHYLIDPAYYRIYLVRPDLATWLHLSRYLSTCLYLYLYLYLCLCLGHWRPFLIHVIHGRDLPRPTSTTNKPATCSPPSCSLWFLCTRRDTIVGPSPLFTSHIRPDEEATRRPRAAAGMASDAARDADADANTIAIH